MKAGPRRRPCPGMGRPPVKVTMALSNGRGRGRCPDCDKDCSLFRTGMVGYHTSHLSKLRGHQ